jgi:DNA helicase-2/ATP-dependent DNA helicase PcrA
LKLVSWSKNPLQEPGEGTARACGAKLRANGDLGVVIELARDVLAASRERSLEISFDDMIWLPVMLGLDIGDGYDVVFVDETQDLCAAQIEIAVRAAVKPGARIVAVGDRFQAIYAFRGAGLGSIARLIDRLNATVLPLSISYRCPLAVIREAKQYVPAIEAAPGAIEGEVRHAGMAALDKVRPGDFVLSRANAPLLPLCLSYLRRGIPAIIQGRDVASQILGRIDRAVEAVGDDVVAVARWIRNWADREIAKLDDDAQDSEVDQIRDIEETVLGVLEGCATVGEVRARCEKLFADVESTEGRVTLSSVHRAKGLEADRVFVLADTLRPDRGEEERNIAYVAVTRAKQSLTLMSASMRKG